jgi:cbb3-type cytochrome oxidase subunit 3
MDVNTLRIAVTVFSLVLFLALMVHTWNRRRRVDHEQAAMLPFMGDMEDSEAARLKNTNLTNDLPSKGERL